MPALLSPPGFRLRVIFMFIFLAVILSFAILLPRTSGAIFHSSPRQPASQIAGTGAKNYGIESVPGELLVRFRANSVTAQENQSTAMAVEENGQQITIRIESISPGPEIVEGLRLARVNPEETAAAIR